MDNDILVLIDYLHENRNNPEVLERFKNAVISELDREAQEAVQGNKGEKQHDKYGKLGQKDSTDFVLADYGGKSAA